MRSISQRLADELNVAQSQINKTVELLDEGATVPFIARYRKEVTGGLDDAQLRQLEERLEARTDERAMSEDGVRQHLVNYINELNEKRVERRHMVHN